MNQAQDAIILKGVRTHNLKNIDLTFPHHKWTVVTGVSGSGKSSLVFDTLFAEAQRRFLETLGTYERQFLKGLPEGEFESIDHLPAAIALKQTNRVGDGRSIVVVTADLAEPLRRLFAVLMDPSCVLCGGAVESHSSKELSALLAAPEQQGIPSNSVLYLTVPLHFSEQNRKATQIVQDLLAEGYFRILAGDQLLELESLLASDMESTLQRTDLHLVLDRISGAIAAEELQNRVETIWSQIGFSPIFFRISVMPFTQDGTRCGTTRDFMVQAWCPHCAKHTGIIQASDLDWQSALGACKSCNGLGNLAVLDANKIVPNPALSIKEGAIKPFQSPTFSWMQDELLKSCKLNGFDVTIPWINLPQLVRDWIWNGEPTTLKQTKEFVSVKNFFDYLEAERYKPQSRILLARYRHYIICAACAGTRLDPVGRHALVHGMRFCDLITLEMQAALFWIRTLSTIPKFLKRIAAVDELYQEVLRKLTLLSKLGLESLSLGRRTRTLSGGEYQRVLLARVIGNGLTDALYVLDEPSVGLGKSEHESLIACVRELRDLGNTVVMVEHEPSIIRAADHWIELGPGDGTEGGYRVPSTGKDPRSVQMEVDESTLQHGRTTSPPDGYLELEGFSCLHCKDLNVQFPLGKLTVISGPSGAGKSTLLSYGLDAALERLLDGAGASREHEDLDAGHGAWKRIVLPKRYQEACDLVTVEQRAGHRTSTSVAATVLGVMDSLRKWFAETREAVELGLSASDFSFNGKGACPSCKGRGFITDDLFFLGEVEKQCEGCNGTRYRQEVLAIKWRNRNIAEWMATSMQECMQAFAGYEMQRPLLLAVKLGLGHLSLGATTAEMSGGEGQRLRIVASLTRSRRKLICLFDEPSRGLSEKDVGHLLETILMLCKEGHTFVVAEHHQAFIEIAHQHLVMGPEGGMRGGKIVSVERCWEKTKTPKEPE